MATQRALPALIPGQRVPMSYEDYLVATAEDVHAEWVNGEVIVFMPPATRHQALIGFLSRLIGLFADLFDLGVVHIAPLEMLARRGGPARQPDILFVAREHLARLESLRLVGPADLIIEVISPESVTRDRIEKAREYAAAGVREYWLVDSRPAVAPVVVYLLNDAGAYDAIVPDASGRYHSVVLPGFWFDPAWVQQAPLPKPLAILQLIAPQALRAALGDGEQ